VNDSRIRLDEILPEVYADLKSIASRALRGERADHSYQTTELVHEIYLRLSTVRAIDWSNSDHLRRAATGVVRRVLVDYARTRNARKRTPDDAWALAATQAQQERSDPTDGLDLLDLESALARLEALDSRKAEIVQLKYFGGQDNVTIARVLGISPTTVKREWALARAWLQRELT
jgi:RNA polymerase sigma factor (TIGR02999 family)